MKNEILTTAQVAEMLTVCRATLDTMRKTGGGPRSMRFGRLVKYRLSDVEAWLSGQHGTEKLA